MSLRFRRAAAQSIEQADIVIFGVPDESRSHATRRGTSTAPDTLRLAANESEFFVRDGKWIPIMPMRGTFDGKRIFDAGNVARDRLYHEVLAAAEKGKTPITVGGDHSLTRDVLAAIHEARGGGKTALLYFDAHPDFVSSARNYYGSVLTDSADFVDFGKSMTIGMRAAEPEELENARKAGLAMLTPIDVAEQGIHRVAEAMLARVAGSRHVYISIDLDCVDPASAPGVSVPSPGGLATVDLLYLLTRAVSSMQVAGLDIVELSPDYDLNNMTAYLAARVMSECIASLKL